MTRMQLLRTRRRLERVERGTALLRRKREALVTSLFALARPAADARVRIAERSRTAYPALLAALGLHGRAGLKTMSWPARVIEVDLEPGTTWGVVMTTITGQPKIRRSVAARGTAPALSGPAAGSAAAAFEELSELLLDAAPREMLIRRLGAALAQTSRQVHTLERRLAPSLENDMSRIQAALDERERDAMVQMRHLMRRRIP
jgi:V/A-type H+-transporting ATPase subunit D